MTRPLRPKLIALDQKIAQAKSSEPNALIQLLSAPNDSQIDALYIHTPFCFHKCHYCDFYSIVDDDRDPQRQIRFVRRLVDELDRRVGQFKIIPRTVFIGGGTPTLLSLECWDCLLQALNRTGVLRQVEEFTVEANPETVTQDLMNRLVAGGVNRISIGTQSFQPALLKTLERWHDPASIPKAVEMILKSGIENFNLDLIFGIPGQTMAMLEDDLARALAQQPTHLSCYGLTYEANTAMTQRLKMGQFQPMGEEDERAMYAKIILRLEEAGFGHYEVSNWGKRTLDGAIRSCRHNLAYWHNLNWLGIGPSAASHVDGRRWKNVAHLGRYMDPSTAPEPPITDEERLEEDRRIGERLMLGLRLIDGIDTHYVDAHVPAGSTRSEAIAYLTQIGMIERTCDRLRLTRQGLFVADAVIRELL